MRAVFHVLEGGGELFPNYPRNGVGVTWECDTHFVYWIQCLPSLYPHTLRNDTSVTSKSTTELRMCFKMDSEYNTKVYTKVV